MQTQTKIPSGSLQVQKGRFHMVIHMEREGKMTPVWRTTGLPAEERFRAQAETMAPGGPGSGSLLTRSSGGVLHGRRQKPQTSAPGRKEEIRRTGSKASPSGTADGGRLSAGVVPVCPSQSGPGDPHQL